MTNRRAIGVVDVDDNLAYAMDRLFAPNGFTIHRGDSLDFWSSEDAADAPAADARGPAHYRTKMAGVMLSRALARAKARARG